MSKIRAEFHIHTNYSNDSILNNFFILLMCKIKKIKLLAITDHNEIKGALKYKEFLKKFNIDVIIGEEIMTNSGEIIGLFLTKKILPMQSIEETISKIKEQNGIIYLPHPYDEKRSKTVLNEVSQNKYKNDIDFIEIHNGRNIKKEFSKKQEQISQELKIDSIIGSDAHTFFELGRNYIEIDYSNLEEFQKNIKSIIKNAKFNKKKCINLSHKITKFVKLLKIIKKGDFNELYRIIFKRCRKKDC